MKDFTQMSESEATAAQNREIAGLRDQLKAMQIELFKERKLNGTLSQRGKIPHVPCTDSLMSLCQTLGIETQADVKKAHLDIPIEDLSNNGCTPDGRLKKTIGIAQKDLPKILT